MGLSAVLADEFNLLAACLHHSIEANRQITQDIPSDEKTAKVSLPCGFLS